MLMAVFGISTRIDLLAAFLTLNIEIDGAVRTHINFLEFVHKIGLSSMQTERTSDGQFHT